MFTDKDSQSFQVERALYSSAAEVQAWVAQPEEARAALGGAACCPFPDLGTEAAPAKGHSRMFLQFPRTAVHRDQ